MTTLREHRCALIEPSRVCRVHRNGRSLIGMSASWEVATATQITRSGATTTGTLAIQLADHIGGSARVSLTLPSRRVVRSYRSVLRSVIRTLAKLTRFRGAKWGANSDRY